jgi:hypothetical protein
MADVNVADNEVGAPNVSLTANTVKTVGFGDDLSEVRIVQPGGTATVYACFVDANHPAAATVDGKHCYPIFASVSNPPPIPVRTDGPTLISLICSATATVWVSAT